MLGFQAILFFMEMGFTKHQIALIDNVFGVIATVLGAALGGFFLHKLKPFKCLLLCEFYQSITKLLFIWLHHSGANITLLGACVITRNFTGGMGAGSLSGFISILCNKEYSATQFALLSSASTFVNNSLTAATGTIIKSFGWDNFFVLTTALSTPEFFVIFVVQDHIKMEYEQR